MILGYWHIRGLAQVPRLLLAYTGQKWTDKLYEKPEDWFQKDKFNMGIAFPNLPYLIDGDLKLTESIALIRYIIHKSGKLQLLGKNLKDQAAVDSLLSVMNDVRKPLVGLFFNSEWKAAESGIFDKIKPKLEDFSNFIGEKDFAIGYITAADFWIAEISHYLHKVYPQQMKKYPVFQRIRKNVQNLPEISNYYSQQSAIKQPFLPGSATIKF